MQGSAFFTLFVATLSNIGLIVINVSVMTAFSYFTQWDLNELIVNQTSTRILLLFITKFLYFLYTRLMLKFFEREKYPLSANDWYIIISLLTISLLFTLIVFSINLHKMFNPTLIVITTSLVVIINIAMYIIIYLQVRNHLSDNRIKIYEDYKAATEVEIKEITEKNNKMRKIKHELKNSGIQIQKLISQGKLEDAEKMIILEVEPPTEEIAVRRVRFYERNGFFFNDYPYIQPSMGEGRKETPLFLMSTERKIDEEEYRMIRNTLYTKVYGKKDVLERERFIDMC